LRTVLGDDARLPQYIETLPKVGYRLIAPVRALSDIATTAGAVSIDASAHSVFGTRPASSAAVPESMPSTQQPAVAQRRGRLLAVAAIVLAVAAATTIALWPASGDTDALTRQLAHSTSFAAEEALELGPRFAPDGLRIVYAQSTGQSSQLVIRALAGQTEARIAQPDALLAGPVFLPDGKRIVFWRRSADRSAIVLRDLQSGEERQVIDCSETPRTVFDVAPDGEHLAMSLRPGPQLPWGIARVRIADGAIERLTSPAAGGPDDVRPRFSPDGRQIAFSRGNASHGRLWLLSAQAPHAARPLRVPEGLDYGVAWLGANGPLLVAADWPGFRSLIRVDLETDDVALVGGRGARFPDVNARGDLVYEQATYRADLWLTSAATPGSAPVVLWPSSRYTNQPLFSPDGRNVVFVSNREGGEALFVGAIGGEARRMTHGDAYRYIRPHWSPAGDALFAVRSPISARQSGPHEGVRIDVASGGIEVLPKLGARVAEVVPLAPSAAGADLLVAETDAGHAMRLVRVRDGRAERLPLPPVAEFQVHGDDLVYLQADHDVPTRCSLATLACAPLPVTIAAANRYHWHLGNGVLWFRAATASGAQRLMRLDLGAGGASAASTSREPAAFDFAPTGNGTSIAASADGTQLIVSRETPPTIDLLLARASRAR
jgi:Tol biopolymer transport system component